MKSAKKYNDPLFVTGTDTGVGKTVLSLLMMQYFFANGFAPFYLKPLQTGCCGPCDSDSDARFIYENVEALRSTDSAASVVYCFRTAKAPLISARDEGKAIDIGFIEKDVSGRLPAANPLIIEGAGDALVPVANGVMTADLAGRLGALPVIAARAGLGTINHTLLTVEALERRGLKAAAIVFLDGGKEPTPPGMIEENSAAIESTCGIKVVGAIGRITDFANPDTESYAVISNLVKLAFI